MNAKTKHNVEEEYTSDPINIPASKPPPQQSVCPEFIRLPRPGTRCNWTGLSRSKLNELVLPCEANGNNPPVSSVCLRKRGAGKGARLICLSSLLGYLRSRIEGGNQ